MIVFGISWTVPLEKRKYFVKYLTGGEIHLNGGVFENSFEHSVRLRLQVQVEQQEAARGDCLATGGCKGENKKDVFKSKVQVLFHLFGQLRSDGQLSKI